MSRINCFGDEQYFGELVPGYGLVRLVNMIAVDPEEEYKEGCWGVTYCNDPDFVFYETPGKDNFDNGVGEHFQDRLYGDIQSCHRFWDACLKAGYNPEVDGYALGYWLADRVYNHLENCSWLFKYESKHPLNQKETVKDSFELAMRGGGSGEMGG